MRIFRIGLVLTAIGLAIGLWTGNMLAESTIHVKPKPVFVNRHLAELETLHEELDDYYYGNVEKYEKAFKGMGAADTLAIDLAWAMVVESKRAGLNPDLILGTIKIEDPMLDPKVRSSAGAVGIMQVMPMHAGKWKCGKDLENLRTNICTGTKIMASYLTTAWDDLGKEANRVAFLNYNGCVSAPGCEVYADVVWKRARLTNPTDVWSTD